MLSQICTTALNLVDLSFSLHIIYLHTSFSLTEGPLVTKPWQLSIQMHNQIQKKLLKNEKKKKCENTFFCLKGSFFSL